MMTLTDAREEIDTVFGDGFAQMNPSLVGAVLQADALNEIDKTLASTAEHLINATGKFNLSTLAGFFK